MATSRDFSVGVSRESTVLEQQAQAEFRKMIFRLSSRLETSDCVNIRYLADLPTSECCSGIGKTNFNLHVLSSLEANGHISPWNVELLESLLSEIHHEDLLPIIDSYKDSKEYKNALKERKKKGKKKKASEDNKGRTCSGDQTTDGFGNMTNQKWRLRSLYTLLITHITGLTQVMEILREELNRTGKEGVDMAMERFIQVAEDGENFTDNLHRVFQDMGIKSNRDSTSSEETPAATPNGDVETRHLKVSSPLSLPSSPVTSSKLPRKKPVPLPRTKSSKAPRARYDLDIYENVGPIKQEEGGGASLEEYHRLVQSATRLGRTESMRGLEGEGEEEDTTENTGDSGIGEWTGHRFQSESNLLDCTHPEKDGCAFALDRAHSEGDMLDSAPYENDAPRYTALLRRNDPIPDEYEDVSYGDNMQRW